MTRYSISHEGPRGWLVTWQRPDGYAEEMWFASREAAQRWIDFVESFEV